MCKITKCAPPGSNIGLSRVQTTPMEKDVNCIRKKLRTRLKSGWPTLEKNAAKSVA
jgi:hypothetical protein